MKAPHSLLMSKLENVCACWGSLRQLGTKIGKQVQINKLMTPSVPNLAADRHSCRLKSHGGSHEKTNCLSQTQEGHYVLVKLNAPLSFVILNRLSLGHLTVKKMNSA